MAEYQTNMDMALVIRHTLAQFADVGHRRRRRVGGSRRRRAVEIQNTDRPTLFAGRVIDARDWVTRTTRQSPLGLVDEIRVQVIPVLWGGGTPLFGTLDSSIALERTHALATPAATHIGVPRDPISQPRATGQNCQPSNNHDAPAIAWPLI